MSTAYAQLVDRIREIGTLQSVGQLLDWDQETGMPEDATPARAEQCALIATLAHEKLTSTDTRKLLDAATAPNDDYVAQTIIRETRRNIERNSKLPTDLVRDVTHTTSLARESWSKARKTSHFETFAPMLSKIVDLKRRVADKIGFTTEPYDALMDEFEPGQTAANVEKVFSDLRNETVPLLKKILASTRKTDQSILARNYPRTEQEKLSRKMAESLCFNFSAGRADVSVHPFCSTTSGPRDVRITTRYDEKWLPAAMYGTLHEVGHALYEQGLPNEHRFTPMADSVSMGIHESQSLMWENMVGRSKPFLSFHFDSIKKMFPQSLGNVTLDQFYGAINTVTPSFIRVEADELTYNLHIVLRFEIERSLIAGKMNVKEVPQVWNAKFKESLGITPPDDAQGCLQDIHWSTGAFGYFPTYALGKLYAAQFFEQARKDIPDLYDRIAANDHNPLLTWLRKNIHAHGRRYRAHELVEKVTGKPLSIQPFMTYVKEKAGDIYGL